MKANGKPPCSGQGNRGFDSLHSDFLNGETEYRDILNTVEIYYAR